MSAAPAGTSRAGATRAPARPWATARRAVAEPGMAPPIPYDPAR